MTRVKLLYLEGYFSSSQLSACGKALMNVGQYVEIAMAREPLSPLQDCANNSFTMLFILEMFTVYCELFLSKQSFLEPYFLYELTCMTEDAV